MSLIQKIESLLFISNKPLSGKQLAEWAGVSVEHIEEALETLRIQYTATAGRGMILIEQGGSVQLATHPHSREVIEAFLKTELTGEMTRPQLEALTIIAYHGPVVKEVVEQIRGVNCTLIIRNLLMRGLIEVVQKKTGTYYQITHDFLRFLGVSSVRELPDYEALSQHEHMSTLLDTGARASAGDADTNIRSVP